MYHERSGAFPKLPDVFAVHGYLVLKNQPTSLGPPSGSRYIPKVGSWEGAVYFERGTTVTKV